MGIGMNAPKVGVTLTLKTKRPREDVNFVDNEKWGSGATEGVRQW
jgi:hypothetical protein